MWSVSGRAYVLRCTGRPCSGESRFCTQTLYTTKGACQIVFCASTITLNVGFSGLTLFCFVLGCQVTVGERGFRRATTFMRILFFFFLLIRSNVRHFTCCCQMFAVLVQDTDYSCSRLFGRHRFGAHAHHGMGRGRRCRRRLCHDVDIVKDKKSS